MSVNAEHDATPQVSDDVSLCGNAVPVFRIIVANNHANFFPLRIQPFQNHFGVYPIPDDVIMGRVHPIPNHNP
jgi:hypothetical protein